MVSNVEITRKQKKRIKKFLGKLSCPFFGKILPSSRAWSKCEKCPFWEECLDAYADGLLPEFRIWIKGKEELWKLERKREYKKL